MKRIIWLDLLRILSIFFVIMIHVTAINWYVISPSTLEWQILNFFNSLSRFCVPTFLMISGALILSKKELDVKKFYKKNTLRLIISLIFWSGIYSILNNLHIFREFSLENIRTVINHFNVFNYHLHFLLPLIGLYIVTPFIRKIIESEKLLNSLLIISIIFSIIIPTMDIIFYYVNMINPNIYLIYQTLTNWFFKINVPFVSGWLVFYLTGYKLYITKIKKPKLIYSLGIGMSIFTIITSSVLSRILNVPTDSFYGYHTINVYITSIAIFIFFKNKISKLKINTKIKSVITNISDSVFGIYLTHDIILIFIKKYNVLYITNSTIFNNIFWSIIIFVICYIIVYIIKKIPKINKYIT